MVIRNRIDNVLVGILNYIHCNKVGLNNALTFVKHISIELFLSRLRARGFISWCSHDDTAAN